MATTTYDSGLFGGYTGYKALFGAKYVDPAIAGSTCVNDTSATPGHPSPITDPSMTLRQ